MSGLRLVVPAATRDRLVCKPEARKNAVLAFIRGARRTLLLSVFRCDDLEILHELGEAVTRGVRVEALVTGRAKGWGKRLGPLAGCLERMGVRVHRFSRAGMKYHAKFMVADGERALVGTMNLTHRCFRRTRDFLVVTHDAGVVAGLAALFRADAAGGELEGGSSERLIVGPDGARQRLEALLAGARRSIRILDHKISDPRILAILRDRQRHGVVVEVESSDAGGSVAPHGRLVVVDHALAVVGSFALSEASLGGRREVGLLIHEAELVKKLDKQFDKASRRAVEAAA